MLCVLAAAAVWCKSRMFVAVWRLARETAALQHFSTTGSLAETTGYIAGEEAVYT